MGRIAGDSPNYTFVLRNDQTGRYIKDCVIELPSVTTVIRRVLAKPALLKWNHTQTRDIFVSLAMMVEDGTLSVEDFIDTFSDPDMASEYLKENGLRPEDVTDVASERGHTAHKHLERLAKLSLTDRDEQADIVAINERGGDPYIHAVSEWWLEEKPEVVAAEQVMFSTKLGYAGTVDLVWKRGGYYVIGDLKTRRAGLGPYESDFVQVGAYAALWNEKHPGQNILDGSVLLAQDDGTPLEAPVPDNYFDVFEHLLKAHDTMRRGEEVE